MDIDVALLLAVFIFVFIFVCPPSGNGNRKASEIILLFGCSELQHTIDNIIDIVIAAGDKALFFLLVCCEDCDDCNCFRRDGMPDLKRCMSAIFVLLK